MGQQQLLLVILGVLIVGIAIAVGLLMFSGTSVSSNKDAIVNEMMNLGQYAYRYKLRPEPLGGGGKSYMGFVLPIKISSSGNASYSLTTAPTTITLTAVSMFGYGTVIAVLDSEGVIGNYTYSGEFN